MCGDNINNILCNKRHNLEIPHRPDLLNTVCPEWTNAMLSRYFGTIDLSLRKIIAGFDDSTAYAKLNAPMSMARNFVKAVNIDIAYRDL
ncbi:hypothetical protein GGI21_001439, partial [Coemansia aciculifera]